MATPESLREIFNLRLRLQMNNRLRLETLAALSKVFREYNEPFRDELLASVVLALPEELPGTSVSSYAGPPPGGTPPGTPPGKPGTPPGTPPGKPPGKPGKPGTPPGTPPAKPGTPPASSPPATASKGMSKVARDHKRKTA